MSARVFVLQVLALGPLVPAADGRAQAPRAANPERPTVATHAYAVAPGYVELEQGLRAFGAGSLAEGTAWDFNLKVGVAPAVQLAFFGAGYVRTASGAGVGDVGWAVKLRRDVGRAGAAALVPGFTVPTGDERRELGAGRVLGSLVAVYSADVAGGWHVDVNAGPTGIGAGRVQWFFSGGLARAWGRFGVATEVFGFTAGGAGARQRGVLVAALVTVADWAVLDVGGVVGFAGADPDQLFLGTTTNLGAIFK